MGRTEEEERKRIDSVMLILRKQKSLTLKQVNGRRKMLLLRRCCFFVTSVDCFFFLQEKFCNDACVERFLRWKGDNVKKTARQIRTCLSWRDSIGAGNSDV